MEYPGAHFTKPWRQFMLYAFIAAFFITAPAIVFYTTGFRYDWHYGIIRETGSISVDVNPKNATVSLDGLSLPDSIPVRLKNITPRTYTLKISAPDYYDWTKEISVSNRETTYIKDIALIKKSRPTFLTKGTITSIVVPVYSRFVLFTEESGGAMLVRRLNRDSGATETLLSLPPHNSSSIVCAPATTWCALNEHNDNETHTMLFDANALLISYPSSFFDVQSVVDGMVNRVQWDDGTNPIVYVSTSDTLYALPLSTRQAQPIAINSVMDWYARSGVLWTLETVTSSNRIGIYKNLAGSKTLVSLLPENTDYGTIHLVEANDDGQIIRTPNETLVVTPTKTWELPLTTTTHSPFNSWQIFWNEQEVWSYTPGSEPTLLYRSDEPLAGVFMLDSHNTLALITTKKMTAFYHYYLVAQDILSEKNNDVAVDSETQTIVYTNKDGLWELNY